MKTRLGKIISVLSLALVISSFSSAQTPIITTAASQQSCPGAVVVPVTVQDMVGVAGISIGLLYDTLYMTYTGYQNVHPGLLSGFFYINEPNAGYIKSGWFGFNVLNIPNDTLFELTFTYNHCEAYLHWNIELPGDCEYIDINNAILPSTWVDGTVTSLAITSQPNDYSATENQNASFTVTAPGATTYQWQESADSITWTNLTNGGMYSGVNSATLTLTSVPLSMNGYQYRVAVSGGPCADTSCSAFLYVSETQPIFTTIGIDSACYTNAPIPVDVDEFYSVASFSLKLNYDPNIVNFYGHQNVNAALSTGMLNTTANGGEVLITWSSPYDVNLGTATLFDLVFIPNPGVSGVSALIWDTIPITDCQYFDLSSSVIPSHFANGSVKMNPKPTPVISGDTEACAYETGLVYSTPLVSGHTYNWNITGGTIVFGYANQITVKWGATGTGSVSVTETNSISGCDSTTADYLVTINPNPTAYTVTGGGGYCDGGTGAEIGLNGSELDVNYQLRRSSSNVGSPVSGTGSAISFGNYTAVGSYSVRATSINGCVLSMNGSVQVSINPLPYQATVTGGGTICQGGGGLSVGIDTSQVGVEYQLYLDGSPLGPTVPGTNAPMSFGIYGNPGTYTVDATNQTTSCYQVMAGSATISITSPPTVDAGPDGTVCQGQSHTLSGSGGNYSAVGWSTAGDGTFVGINTLNATYTPGQNDIANGSVILNITAFGLGNCPNVNDNMELTINHSPTVNAGPDDSTCTNIAYQLNGVGNNNDHILWTGGDGVFNDSTLLNATYTPGPGDIANDSVILVLTVYGMFPCDTLYDDMVLYFLPTPMADAGADATICEGGTHTLNGSAVNYTSLSWTGGDGSFDDPSILNPTYTPGLNDIASGSVFLTMVAYGSCGYDSDYMTLTINNQPTADAGADATICAGQTYPLSGNATNYSSVSWSRSGDGVFLAGSTLNATYIPGIGDRAAGTVTLTLHVNGLSPCGNTSDDMILSIAAPATADAGADATICEGQPYTLNGAANNYSAVSWSGGDGTFDDNTLLGATYTPGQNDIAAGSVTLTFTATGISPCGDVSDDMVLTIIPGPTADAGADATICETGSWTLSGAATDYSSVAWTTDGDGSFNDNILLGAVYTPGMNDITTGVVTLTLTAYGNAPCGDASDEMILTIVPAPTADAGADVTICEGDFVALNGMADNYSGISWSGGDGTFDDNTLLGATYTPGTNDIALGSVTLTLTVYGNSPCDDATDVVVVTIIDAPTADAGADATICSGDDYKLSGVATHYTSVVWTGGDGTFNFPNYVGATYTPGPNDIAAGFVTLTLNVTGHSPCGTVTDEMVLNINPAPTADAGADATICENQTYLLNGNANNYSALSWSGGDGTFDDNTVLAATYTPGPNDIANGSVTLTLTAYGIAPCGDASDVMLLVIELAPTADAGADGTICEGDYYSLDGTATNYSSIMWTGGDGTFDDNTSLYADYTPGPNDVTAGSVILTLTVYGNAPCGDAMDEMELTIVPAAAAFAGDDATICEGENYTLNGMADNYSSIMWTGGDGSFDDNTILGATYTPGINDIMGGSVILTLTAYGNSPCGDAMDEMVLTIVGAVTADAGDNGIICEGEYYSLNGTATNYSSVMWTGGDGTFDDNTSLYTDYTPGPNDVTAGSVILTLTVYGNAPCGDAMDEMELTIVPAAAAYAGDDATICEGENYTLNGMADNYSSITWTGGDGSFDDNTILGATYTPGPNDIVAGSVILTLTAYGNAPCSDALDEIVLTIIGAATADAGADGTICEGEYYSLDGTATNYSSIMWTGGDGTFDDNTSLYADYTPGPNDIANGSVILTLTAYGNSPCADAMDEIELTIVPEAVADAGADATICEGENYTLNGMADNYSSVMWTGGDGSFDDNTILGATYTPGPNDIMGGSVILTLTAYGNTPCGDAMDEMLLTIVAAATADAGTDGTVCEGESWSMDGTATNYTSVMWTGGDGTFDDNTSLYANYTPGPNDIAAGIVTITLTAYGNAPCNDAMDDMMLTINQLPLADAGADQTIPYGTTTTLDGSGTGGSGTYVYSWTPVALLVDPTIEDPATVNLNANQQFDLVVTDALTGCVSLPDNMTVEVSGGALTANPQVIPQSICEGEMVTLTSNATGGSGTYTYLWTSNPAGFNSTLQDPTDHPVVNTWYILTVDDGYNTYIDSVFVNVYIHLTADAGADATICEDAIYTLNGLGTSYSSVLWTTAGDGTFDDATLPGANYTPGLNDLSSGSVTLTFTAYSGNPCPDASDDMNLYFQMLPTAYAGADAAICEGETYTLSGTASNQSSVLWTTAGDGTFDDASILGATYTPGPNDIANGSVVIMLTADATGPCSTAAAEDMTLTINNSPVAEAGSDQTICDGDCTTITASGGVAYVWNTGETDAAISVCPTVFTTYTVTVTDANGCTASDDVNVDVISCGTPVMTKTMLQGPYAGSGMMNTGLQAYLPLTQPYNTAPWNYAGTESIGAVPANMVDWILVELRDAADGTTVIARRAAILLSDGSIVDTDMSTAVTFDGLTAGNYYITLHHRNHMPVMSANPVTLPNASAYDFSDVSNYPPYGGAAQALIELASGVYGMITGDVNGDGNLKYSGPSNDRGLILQKIITVSGSTSITTTINGYYSEDLNMDGTVKYSGPGNDQSIIIQTLVNLTGSTSITSVYTTPVP